MMRRRRGILIVASAIVVLLLAGIALTNILLWYPLIVAQRTEPIRISDGMIQGLTQGGVAVYRGIPFAAPPVGDLRWRAPQPVAPWDGIRAADRFHDVCMQTGDTVPGLGAEPMSEDCLYLNVWTPAEAPDDRLPVMVWLYGGGNHVGSGSARLYWGDRLARKGVVVVTLNYRLGAFGMFAHPELSQEAAYNASGNYLLLDQIAALRWVQENATAFGGDPENVTLFGQSAGATGASQLIVSPLARGLFHQVIAQSGGDLRGALTVESSTVLLAQAEQIGSRFAAKFGVNSVAELRRVPAEEILAMDQETLFDNGTPRGPHRVNVDGVVLPGYVIDLYEQAQQHHVPLMVGYNAGDDAQIHRGAGRNWARLHARRGNNKVFSYYFSRVPPYPPFRRTGTAGHGAELLYVFGFPPRIFFYAVEFPWNATRDNRLVDAIQTYWTNFAKTGDPNGSLQPQWPAFNDHEQVLEIGDSLRVIKVLNLPDA